MRKPSHSPPPPPVPPPPVPPPPISTEPPLPLRRPIRCISPSAMSCHSLPPQCHQCCWTGGGGGSEHDGADSVQSMPIGPFYQTNPQSSIRSHISAHPPQHSFRTSQPRIQAKNYYHTNANYLLQSNHQKSPAAINYNNNRTPDSASSCYSSAKSQPILYGSAHRLIDGVATPIYRTPDNSVNGNNLYDLNNLNNNNNNSSSSSSSIAQSSNNFMNNNNVNYNNNHIASPALPASSKPKILRPKLTISPKPELKKVNSNYPPRMKCKSLHYKRLVEQHFEKLFKYLKAREQRRLELEAELRERELNDSNNNAQTYIKILAVKESSYLRSLRARYCRDDFKVLSLLGRGYFGSVYLVELSDIRKDITTIKDRNSEPAVFAMKKLKKAQVFTQNHVAHVMAERDILAEADNEWIVKLYCSFQDSKNLYFILEYIPGGDMMNLLQMQHVFPESWARFYIAEISLAVQFVHDMGFIHRDIKPDNILIDANGHIKLTDFGLCTGFRWTHDSSYYRDETNNNNNSTNLMTNVGETMQQNEALGFDQVDQEHPTITNVLTTRELIHSRRKKNLSLVGSPNYIAPEVLRQAFEPQIGADERLCDWWSVGVILYEMVIGYCPFIDKNALNSNFQGTIKNSPIDIQQRILNWRAHLTFPSLDDDNALDSEDPSALPRQEIVAKIFIEEETKDLIKGLLTDPQDRLCKNGIDDLKNHRFFRDIDWENIRTLNEGHRNGPPYVPKLMGSADTSHFCMDMANIQKSDLENHSNSGTTIMAGQLDFTHVAFWINKPMK